MLTLNDIPPGEIALELFHAGRFERRFAPGDAAAVHAKTCPHLIWAQATQGRYAIVCGDGRSAELASGEAFLTPANLPLRITHYGDTNDGHVMRARWLHMRVTLFGAIDAASLLDLPLHVKRKECETLGNIAEAALALPRREKAPCGGKRSPAGAPPPTGLGRVAARHALAFRALEALCDLAPLRREAADLLGQRERLAAVLAFMQRNLHEKLDVAALARQVHMSTPHFHAFFKRFVGLAPMQHLRTLRLARACRLLAGGEDSLKTVAQRTGFCNAYHLSREFRRQFGKPPGRWRHDYDQTLA